MIIDEITVQRNTKFWCSDCNSDRQGTALAFRYADGEYGCTLCRHCAQAIAKALLVALVCAKDGE